MTELLTRPDAADADDNMDAFEADLQNQSGVETEQLDNRELSPTGSRLRHAAERVANFFDDRAMDKARSGALDEQTKRNKALQQDAYTSYDDNISFTRNRISNERVDAVNAKINAAQDRITSFGRTALHGAVAVGEVTLGLGIIAGEAAYNAGKSTVEAAVSMGETGYLNTLLATDSAKEKFAEVKDKASERHQKAKTRRAERRERWAARRHSAAENVRGRAERTLARGHTARAAGSAALSAFNTTYKTHTEQNK